MILKPLLHPLHLIVLVTIQNSYTKLHLRCFIQITSLLVICLLQLLILYISAFSSDFIIAVIHHPEFFHILFDNQIFQFNLRNMVCLFRISIIFDISILCNFINYNFFLRISQCNYQLNLVSFWYLYSFRKTCSVYIGNKASSHSFFCCT